VKPAAIACGLGLVLLSSCASAGVGHGVRETEPPLGLDFDFQVVDGAEVTDGSSRGYVAKLDAGSIVLGRRKPAVQFSGNGQLTMADVPKDLDPTGRALTVGAMCRPTSPDGVLISMGGAQDGFSLYLHDGVPQFAVRSAGVLHKVSASEPLNLGLWVHLAGVIGPKGELSLLVNTSSVASAAGALVAQTPTEPLSVGADPGSPVGEYSGPANWQGLVQDVRLYWGVLSREKTREALGDWADRPGCGCRK
jgi:hypothetical protein